MSHFIFRFSRKSRLHRKNKEWMKSKWRRPRRRWRRQHMGMAGKIRKSENQKRVSVKSQFGTNYIQICLGNGQPACVLLGFIFSASLFRSLSISRCGLAAPRPSGWRRKNKNENPEYGNWKATSFIVTASPLCMLMGMCARARAFATCGYLFFSFLFRLRRLIHTNWQMMVICSKRLLC